MKRIYTLSLALLAFALVLNSCGSSLTVTKRHHNKGYYVSFNKLKKSHDTEVSDDKLVLSEEEYNYEEIVPEENEISTVASVENTENESAVITDFATEQKELISPIVKKSNSEVQKSEIKNKVPGLKEMKQIKSVYKEQVSSSPRTEDGLSLFWIVILIILLLWLVGLIIDIGALVHILLVVALILLILWLLGII